MRVTERDVIRARVHFINWEPFFGPLALGLKLVMARRVVVVGPQGKTEIVETPVMATDGVHLFVNPNMPDTLFRGRSREQVLRSLVIHEALHPALGHIFRRGVRDAELWNVAADLTVHEIMESGGLDLPPFGLQDPSLDGLSTEAKYARLLQQKDEGGGGGGRTQPEAESGEDGQSKAGDREDDQPNGGRSGTGGKEADQPDDGEEDKKVESHLESGRPDAHLPPGELQKVDEDGTAYLKPLPEEETNQLADEWKGRTAAAAQQARNQGRLPAAMERWVQETVNPRLDARSLLREFLVDTVSGRSDFTWARPSKAFLGGSTNCMLPSLRRGDRLDLVFAVDTSGSINQKELALAFGVAAEILSAFPEVSLTVLDCDAKVHGARIVEDVAELEGLKFRGGGGTDFRPVFEWVERNLAVPPRALIYVTDLCGRFPEQPSPYEVLWLCTWEWRESAAPFGRLVAIRPEELAET